MEGRNNQLTDNKCFPENLTWFRTATDSERNTEMENWGSRETFVFIPKKEFSGTLTLFCNSLKVNRVKDLEAPNYENLYLCYQTELFTFPQF